MLSLSGAPAEFSSVTFFKVFVKEAIEFVKKHPDYTASDLSIESNSEFQTSPGDEEEEDDADTVVNNQFKLINSQLSYVGNYSINFYSNISQNGGDNNLPSEGIDMEELSELLNEELQPEILCPEYDSSEEGDSSSTVPIYTGATGKIAVPQHIHYSYRGNHFQNYSLYEFASIVDVVPKKKENNQEDTGTVTSQDTIKENSNKVSRPEVPVYYMKCIISFLTIRENVVVLKMDVLNLQTPIPCTKHTLCD